jgi:hypothetical protein
MDMRFKLRWAGAETGPYTKEQIDDQLDSRKIGLACEVHYNGKWILLATFKDALEKDAQDLRDQEKGRKLKEEKDAASAVTAAALEAEREKARREEEQAAIYHERQLQLLAAENRPPPVTVPSDPHGESYGDPNPPSPPWNDSHTDNSSTRGKAAGGGFGVFVAIVLGILWYQGYFDPTDIPALWGNSKYIDVVREDKPSEFGGKTVGQAMSSLMTSVTWKSSRGDNRKEIRITCFGKRDGSPKKIPFIVNKQKEKYRLEEGGAE